MARVARVAGLVVALAVATSGCPGKGATSATPKTALVAQRGTSPVDVNARIPLRTGSCAQVKSVKDKDEADKVKAAIEKALSIPVDEVRADLGERGIWWRICVGDEESEARIVALATKWTAPGGQLEPFLDEATDGSPRFFVLSRENAEKRHATDAATGALAGFALEAGAPAFLFAGPEQATLAIASTALAQTTTASESTDAVAVAATGAVLLLDDKAAPGCATCELALRNSPVVARRVVGAGDVTPTSPGEELLVEERTQKGVRVLSVLALEGVKLVRAASLVLENARPGFASSGKAQVVEADLDPQKEIVLQATDLITDGDNGCAVQRHAAVYDFKPGQGLARIDALKLPSAPADAVVNVITVLDAAGDHDAASHACAAQMSKDPQAATAQLCLQRVRRLVDAGALVDAVNAAGLVAEAAPSLRPVIAAPFAAAAATLDKDPRLFAGEEDCRKSPLVQQLSSRPLEASFRLAAEKAANRLPLADVADAVFVTGERDFGKDSPVGAIVDKWLQQAKVALPARYAAVEALLLPQAPEGAAP